MLGKDDHIPEIPPTDQKITTKSKKSINNGDSIKSKSPTSNSKKLPSKIPRSRSLSNPATQPLSHSTPKIRVTRASSSPHCHFPGSTEDVTKEIGVKHALKFSSSKSSIPENTSWSHDDVMVVRGESGVLSDEDVESASIATSDISSILSFDSTDHLNMMPLDALHFPVQKQAGTVSPDQSLSKSRSCSNVENLLPSQRIMNYVENNKDLYKRSHVRQTRHTTPTQPPGGSPSSKLSKGSLSSKPSSIVLTSKSPTNSVPSSKSSLKKSSSTHGSLTQSPQRTVSPAKELSSHLKYGIFDRGSGVKKSASFNVESERRQIGIPRRNNSEMCRCSREGCCKMMCFRDKPRDAYSRGLRTSGSQDRVGLKTSGSQGHVVPYRRSLDASSNNGRAGNGYGGSCRPKRSMSSASLGASVCSGESELSTTCQKLQKQNGNLQKCLTVSQDRAIRKINQLKDTTHTVVDEHRELVSSMHEKDYRITSLKEQLQSISSMGAPYSDTESIASEASEYNNDIVTDNLRRRNGKLKDKIRRLEDVLAKCKTTIKNGIDASNSLNTEKEELASKLEKAEFELEEERLGKEVASTNKVLGNEVNADNEVADKSEVLIDLGEDKQVDEGRSASDEDHLRITELLGEVARHKEEVNARSNEIFQLVTEIERMKQDVIKLNSEAESQKQQAEYLTTELTLSKQLALESNQYSETLKQEFSVRENSLHQQISEYKEEKEHLHSQVLLLESEKEKLSNALHDRDVTKAMELQDTRTEHTGQITLLNNKIVALKKELDDANRQLNILKDTDTSLQDLLEEMSGIRGELERVSTENTDLRHELSVRDRQLQESKEEKGVEVEESAKQHRLTLQNIEDDRTTERKEYEVKVLELTKKQEDLSQEISRLVADCEKFTKDLTISNEERAKEKAEWENKIQRLEDSKIHEREGLEESHRSQLTPFKTKIKEMQAQITKLQDVKLEQEEEISDLTRHVFESNSDCAQLNNEVTVLQGKLAATQNSVSLMQDQIKSKTTECVDLADSLTSTKENLDAVKLTLGELQSQFDQLSEENAGLSRVLESEQCDRQKLAHENTDLKKKLKQCTEEHSMKCSQLETVINDVMSEKESGGKELEELKERYCKLKETLATNSDGSVVLSEENKQLICKATELETSLASLQEQLDCALAENNKYKKEAEVLKSKLAEIESQHSNACSNLENSITELKHALECAQNEKDEFENKVVEIESERDIIVQDANQRKEKFEEEHRSIEDLLTQVKQDLLVCEEQLNSSKLDNEKYKEKVGFLAAKIQQLESSQHDNAGLLANIKELETDKDIKSKFIAKLEADTITTTSEFTSHITSLKQDLESSHTTCELLRKQFARSQEEVDESERQRKEEVRALEGKREDDLKMYAAQHQDELKKQSDLEKQGNQLSEQIRSLESRLETEIANHQKAKEGLGKASQAIGKLRGYVKEQENKIVSVTKLNEELVTKNKEESDRLNMSISEVQSSYMQKLEAAVETENSLKMELNSSKVELNSSKLEMDSSKMELSSVQSERSELESRVGELVEEKKQLTEIMRSKIEENNKLLAQVQLAQTEEVDNKVIADKETEISDLKEKLSLQRNEMKQLQNEMQSCKNTENQLKIKLVELKKKAEAKIFELLEDKKKREEEISALSIDHQQSSSIISEITSKLSAVENEKSSIESQIEEMRSEFDSQISVKSQVVETTKSDLQWKENEIESLSEQLEKYKEQLKVCEHKIPELQCQLDDALLASSDLNSQVLVLQKNLEDADRNMDLAKSDEVHEKYAELNTAYREIEKELFEQKQLLEDSCKENDEILQKYSLQLEEKDKEIEDLKLNLEESLGQSNVESDKAKQRELNSESLRLEVETLQSNYASLQNEQQSLKKEKESLEKEKKSYSKEIESLQKHIECLQEDVLSVKDELSQSIMCLEEQERITSSSQEQEVKLKEELETLNIKLKEETVRAAQLQALTGSLKSEMTSHTDSQEQLSLLCNQFKQKISQLQTSLSDREEELHRTQDENSKLTSHTSELEEHLTVLRAEKDKIVESVSMVISDKEIVERRHKEVLEEVKMKMSEEHAVNVEQITRVFEQKILAVSQDEQLVQSLQNQVKKHQLSVSEAQEELKSAQSKFTVTVSEYSSKLLSSEKKYTVLRDQFNEQAEVVKSRDQEIQKTKSDYKAEISLLKRDTISKCSHDELVFNLEMAYNMNLQESTDRLEGRIKELESMIGQDDIPSQKGTTEDMTDMKRHLDNLTRRYKLESETIRNEAVFAANQEYNAKLKEWQEAYEQKHLEEVNRVMEENSRERQRLLREIEVLQNTPKHHPHLTTATLNTSTSPGSGGGRGGGPGRISISSDQSDLFLLDTEFEYLKDILLKYLKGEHTEQLLKVIIAILRYSDEEKVQILKTLTGRK